jgi:hypothetical protein
VAARGRGRAAGCADRGGRGSGGNAARAGRLDLIHINRRVVKVALVDLALWFLEIDRNYSTTTGKRVGRPWRARSVEAQTHANITIPHVPL